MSKSVHDADRKTSNPACADQRPSVIGAVRRQQARSSSCPLRVPAFDTIGQFARPRKHRATAIACHINKLKLSKRVHNGERRPLARRRRVNDQGSATALLSGKNKFLLRGAQMLIQMDLLSDLEQLTVDRLVAHGFKAEAFGDLEKLYAHLHAHVHRLILPTRYEIKFSRQIKENPKFQSTQPIIEEITGLLKVGQSVLPYLSNQVLERKPKKIRRDDTLIFWGIHHLHLSSQKTLERGMVLRADNLLLIRFEKGVAHLIDIVSHDTPNLWTDTRWLKIVDENWPHLHHRFNNVRGRDLSPEEIWEIRKINGNSPISINGNAIMPTMGIMSNGVPADVLWELDRLTLQLKFIQDDVRNRFHHYFDIYAPFNQSRAHVRLIGLDGVHFELAEEISKRRVAARWLD